MCLLYNFGKKFIVTNELVIFCNNPPYEQLYNLYKCRHIIQLFNIDFYMSQYSTAHKK